MKAFEDVSEHVGPFGGDEDLEFLKPQNHSFEYRNDQLEYLRSVREMQYGVEQCGCCRNGVELIHCIYERLVVDQP